MGKYHRPLAAATVVAAALVPAAAAHAATKSVTLGLAKNPAGTPESASFYDFFPRKVKIHAGDKIAYKTVGFGLVYSGPKSKAPSSLITTNAAAPVAGANDAAGQPFWFNGQPGASINPALLGKAGDGKVRKGQKDVDHDALSLGDNPKAYKLTFAKPGKYKVYDALHPGVVNTVTVVKKGKKVPGKAADRAAVTKQANALKKEANRLAAVNAPGNTILAGNDSTHVGFFQFFPPAATVKVGEPVTVEGGSRVNFTHDFAIGPDAFMKSAAATLVAPGANGVGLNPAVVYPSQPGNAGLTFDGTQNGGFVNTGLIDTDPNTAIPDKTTITFTKPGTYKYVCLVHSDGIQGMSGTITVQ